MKVKRIIGAVLTLATVFTSVCIATTADTAEILPGDFNGDGVINSKDIALLKLHLNGKIEIADQLSDANRDGVTDINDIYSLADMTFDKEHIHKWTAWEIIQNATETEAGIEKRICEYCGQDEINVIPATGNGENAACEHAERINETIYLAPYGACGGEINCYRCATCDEICDIYGFNYGGCEEEYSNADHIDDDGKDHRVSVRKCIKCGLTTTEEHIVTDTDGCYVNTDHSYTVTIGDTVIAESHGQAGWVEHEYKYEITSGECGGEHTYTQTCLKCGETYENELNGHHVSHLEVDMAQLGACGGYITLSECRACGKRTDIYRGGLICELEFTSEIYTDASGAEYEKQIHTCKQCGLVYTDWLMHDKSSGHIVTVKSRLECGDTVYEIEY